MAATVEELGRAFLEQSNGESRSTLRDGVCGGTIAPASFLQELLRCTFHVILGSMATRGLDAEDAWYRLLSPDPDLLSFVLLHVPPPEGVGAAGPERGATCRYGADAGLAAALARLLAAIPDGAQVADLGPLYESMLRYSATRDPTFRLVLGNGRKQGGSYYTPPGLVSAVIQSTLAPIVSERTAGRTTTEERESAILGLRVCDPACGCGHFLLAAIRYLAGELQAARGPMPETERGHGAYRAVVREVAASCIYGVDRDPLAATLCRLALLAEGAPPMAADHIKLGDSLLGAIDPETMARVATPDGPGGSLGFHWPRAFPDVFAAGGFDVVLANPPWEMLQPEEVSFFAARGRLDIAGRSGAERKAAIDAQVEDDPALWQEWLAHRRTVDETSRLLRGSGCFPLAARGKLNLSSAFVETILTILHPDGRAGCVVPSGLITDDGTKHLFHALLDGGALVSLYHFDNRGKLFPEVSGNLTFCLLTVNGSGRRTAQPAFAFFLHHPDEVGDPAHLVPLSPADLALLNPNTRTCPIFRSRRDASLSTAIHRRVPILLRDGGENPWDIRLRQGIFNMTSASHLFRRAQTLEEDGWIRWGDIFCRGGERYLPLYEAKMLHHFDHRWANGEPGLEAAGGGRRERGGRQWPRYWIPERELDGRLTGLWTARWLLGYRLVCRSTDERTVVGTVLPRVGCGNSILLLYPGSLTASAASQRAVGHGGPSYRGGGPSCEKNAGDASGTAYLAANLNSLILDYQARQKLGGINLNFHVLKQLPVLPPSAYLDPAPWSPGTSLGTWISERVLDLVYTDCALQPFARALGYEGDPFPRQAERRHRLRCELDAAYFCLYGLDADDAAYVLDTFPGVRRKDMAQFGEFRTKRVILQILAEMLRGSAPRHDPRSCPAAN